MTRFDSMTSKELDDWVWRSVSAYFDKAEYDEGVPQQYNDMKQRRIDLICAVIRIYND